MRCAVTFRPPEKAVTGSHQLEWQRLHSRMNLETLERSCSGNTVVALRPPKPETGPKLPRAARSQILKSHFQRIVSVSNHSNSLQSRKPDFMSARLMRSERARWHTLQRRQSEDVAAKRRRSASDTECATDVGEGRAGEVRRLPPRS